MYKNVLEVKNNIDSLKWGREEKVTNTISRRRLINDGASGYSYKYYMPTSPNKYIVMSAGKKPYVINDIAADATAFGVDNGKVGKVVDYLNDSYIHRENLFKDNFFDKLGNTAIKDFKLSYQRKQKKSKNESSDKYAETVKKEFIEKLKPELIKTAERKGLKLSDFNIINTTAGGIYPRMRFYLGKLPVVIEHSTSKGEKYFGYIPSEPENNKQIPYFDKVDKVLQLLVKFINNTLSERTKNLIKDPEGLNLRVQEKSDKDKKGTRENPGTSLRLQYEENIENNMILKEDLGFNKKIAKFNKCIDKLETKNNKHIPKNDKQKEYKKELKEYIRILRNNSKELKKLNDYKEFETEEQKKNAKEIAKRLLKSQKNFITGVNNSGFIGFLKELGLGTIMGALIGGFSYLLNNYSYKDEGTVFLGPGARAYAASKNLYNELDAKKIISFDAAEKGLWVTLLGTAATARNDYDNTSRLGEFKFNLPNKKDKAIKEDYFPY